MYMPSPPLYLKIIFRVLHRARPLYSHAGIVYFNPNGDGTFNWAVDEVAGPTDDGVVMGRVQRFVRDLIVQNTNLAAENEKLRKQLSEKEASDGGN